MKKSTLIAVAVFAVLALTFWATREKQVNVGVRKLTFAPLNADSVVAVEMGAVSLRLDGTQWKVNSFPADEAQVKALVQALADLKADDFVTERTEKHAELEVDEAKGLTVKASTSTGVVRDVVLGKASKSGGTYLRDAKSNEVFVTRGGLASLARRGVAAWRKKSITTAKADEIAAVKVSVANGNPYTLEAGGEKLTNALLSKDYRFDSEAGKRMVAQLAALTAQDFEEGEPKEQLNSTLELATKDGKTLALHVGEKRADGTSALRVDGDAQTYLLPSWQAELLLKDVEGYRDMRLLTFEPSQVSRLTVTSPGKKTVVQKEGEVWKLVEPSTAAEFDAEQVARLVSRLASLRGLRVVRDVAEGKTGLAAAPVQVEVMLPGGPQRLRLSASGPNASEVYAKGTDGLVYALGSQDKASFEKGAEMFKRPPPPPSFNGAQGLDQLPPEIRRQLEAQLRAQPH